MINGRRSGNKVLSNYAALALTHGERAVGVTSDSGQLN
jgi:hypothetical protein